MIHAWPPEGAISVTCGITQIKRVSLAPSVRQDGLTFSVFQDCRRGFGLPSLPGKAVKVLGIFRRGTTYTLLATYGIRRPRPTSGAASLLPPAADLRRVMMGLHTNCTSFRSHVHDFNSAASSNADHQSVNSGPNLGHAAACSQLIHSISVYGGCRPRVLSCSHRNPW